MKNTISLICQLIFYYIFNDKIPVLNSPKSSVIEPVSTPPPNILSSWTDPVVRLMIAFLFSLTSSPDLNWLPLQSNFFATSLIYQIRNYAWLVWRNFLTIAVFFKLCTFSTFTSDRPLIAIRSLLEACKTAVSKGLVYPDYLRKILVHFNSGLKSYRQWCEFRHLVTSLCPKHWSQGIADPLLIYINGRHILHSRVLIEIKQTSSLKLYRPERLGPQLGTTIAVYLSLHIAIWYLSLGKLKGVANFCLIISGTDTVKPQNQFSCFWFHIFFISIFHLACPVTLRASILSDKFDCIILKFEEEQRAIKFDW